jgi:hypothetical protein
MSAKVNSAKHIKKLSPIPKLFHIIVNKRSTKCTLLATLLSYQKQERRNKGK